MQGEKRLAAIGNKQTNKQSLVCASQPTHSTGHEKPQTICIKEYSCICIYAHSCLKPLSNPLKAVFKQLKPYLNHVIRVLFEHGFYIKILKTGRRLFTCARLSRNKHFALMFVDVNIFTFRAE